MSRYGKLIRKIVLARSDNNISFTELCSLLTFLGFKERIRGSHHIFTKEGISEIINLQPKGSAAKPYQVKQIREILSRYKLGEISDE